MGKPPKSINDSIQEGQKQVEDFNKDMERLERIKDAAPEMLELLREAQSFANAMGNDDLCEKIQAFFYKVQP